MGVIRVQHNENYTTMSNYHLRDNRLSLRAMGLMSKMLSLPDDWDYTVAGLAAICKEGREAVRKVLQELEEAGYIVRDQSRESGRFSGYDYTLYEQPRETEVLPDEDAPTEPEEPCAPTPSPSFPGNGAPPSPRKPSPRKPLPENPPQLNNYTTKGLKNKYTPPPWMPRGVWDAITDYCREDEALFSAWMDYADMRRKIRRAVSTVNTVTRCCSTLDQHSKGSRAYKIGMLHKATDRSWRGLFPLEAGDEGFAPETATQAASEEAEEWL